MKKITMMLLMAAMGITNANAQWNTDTAVNTLVAASSSSDSQSVGTSTGETYVVFWKTVADPVNYELRVQLLDANGVQQFGPDGMLVSNTLPMSTYTVIWNINIDADDNLYIGATGTGDGTPGFAYKISPEGGSMWPGGISLGTGYVPKVFPLSNGDVVISYFPGSGKGKIQRYTSAGTAVWAAPVEIIPAAAYSTRSTIVADIYELANGDLTTVFHTRTSFGVSSLLFAQKYTAEGEAVWAVPTQLADQATAYNSDYSGTQDGDVVYYGYSTSHSNRFDSYVQRLNADGTTPWGMNGMDFDTNQTNYEMDTRIAFEPGSDYVWAICGYTNTSQSQVGEYVQKFDKATGARQLTNTAKQVFAISGNFDTHAGELHLLNDMPLFISKHGYDNGVTPVTLNATFLDENGDILPDGNFPVATFAASKSDIMLNTPVDGQAVVVFSEQRVEGEQKIYAQSFEAVNEPEPDCTFTTVALPDITAQCSVTLGDITAPTVNDSCGNVITPTTDASIFPVTEQGTVEITWTYTAEDGDTATQTQNIVVDDTELPVLVLQNVTAALVDGEVTISAGAFNNGSTDNCGGAAAEEWVWTVLPDSFTCDDLGEQTVTITLTDANGNTATATATVTVQDPSGDCTASAPQFGGEAFALYPNPASDVLHIDVTNGTVINSVKVYSLLGQELYNSGVAETSKITIPLGKLAVGTYLVSIQTEKGTYMKQVIKAN